MKNNLVYGIIAMVIILFVVVILNNIFKKDINCSKGNDLNVVSEESLGNLCSGKEECRQFCLNNRGQCPSNFPAEYELWKR